MVRKLRSFFTGRKSIEDIFEIIGSDELTLIDRFLSAKDKEYKEQVAGELMERTLNNIDPEFLLFVRLFEVESQKLTSLEEAVTHLHEDYRSHYIHSVYVYLLGFYLLQDEYLGKQFLQNLNLSYFDSHHRDQPVYDNYVNSFADERKEFQKRWAMTAFFHDMAYLSQVNLKIMQVEGERLTNLKNPYSISIHDLQSFLTLPMLSTVKKKIKLTFAPDYMFNEDVLDIIGQRMFNRIGFFSKKLIYQSLKEHILSGLKGGRFDHGLMGAIFLMQRFYSLIHSFFSDEEIGETSIRYSTKLSLNRNIIRFTDAMTAVALHNVKDFKTGIFKPDIKVKIINHKLPLAFLLILCDELQTWERELDTPDSRSSTHFVKLIKEKRLEKNMFFKHFEKLYKLYLAAGSEVNDNKLVFYLPYLDDKDELQGEKKDSDGDDNNAISYTITFPPPLRFYKGAKTNSRQIEIEFRNFRLPFLLKILGEMNKKSTDYKFKKKPYEEIEKEAWNSFSKIHKTLALFTDLAFGIKKMLRINSQPAHSNVGKNRVNINVQSLEYFFKGPLLHLKLLKKGQDKLIPYLKPYHFHDFRTSRREEERQAKSFCSLCLHYPGKDIEDIDRVIKDRIEKNLFRTDAKKIILSSIDYPELSLNNVINQKYIPLVEECLFGIHYYQLGEQKIEIKKEGI